MESVNNDCIYEMASDVNIASDFAWLDKWMMYLIWVPVQLTNIKRSKQVLIFVRFWYILSCLIIIIHLVFDGVADTLSYVEIGKTNVSHFIFIIANLLQICAEILTRYYWYYHFNYLWYNSTINIDYVAASNAHNSSTSYVVNKYKYIIQLCVFVRFSIPFLVILLFPFFEPMWTWAVASIFGIVGAFFFAPSFFSVINQCVICFKYYLHLCALIGKCETSDPDDILIEYKWLFKSFKRDYNCSLKWCINLMVVSYLWMIWVNVDQLRTEMSFIENQNNITRFAINASWVIVIDNITSVFIIVILYMLSGNVLTNAFETFQQKLWESIEDKIENKSNNIIQSTLTLITYSNNYPIVICLGSVRISKKNVVVFAITFIVTKFAKEYFVI
eukprot:490519_1